jgi:hypothetical protein
MRTHSPGSPPGVLRITTREEQSGEDTLRRVITRIASRTAKRASATMSQAQGLPHAARRARLSSRAGWLAHCIMIAVVSILWISLLPLEAPAAARAVGRVNSRKNRDVAKSEARLGGSAALVAVTERIGTVIGPIATVTWRGAGRNP